MATRKFPGSCLIKVNKSLVFGVKYICTAPVKFVEWLLFAKNYISGTYAFSHLILTIEGIIVLILQTRKLGLERLSKAKITQPINKCLPDFKAGAFRHYSVNYIFKKQTSCFRSFLGLSKMKWKIERFPKSPWSPNMQDLSHYQQANCFLYTNRWEIHNWNNNYKTQKKFNKGRKIFPFVERDLRPQNQKMAFTLKRANRGTNFRIQSSPSPLFNFPTPTLTRELWELTSVSFDFAVRN